MVPAAPFILSEYRAAIPERDLRSGLLGFWAKIALCEKRPAFFAKPRAINGLRMGDEMCQTRGAFSAKPPAIKDLRNGHAEVPNPRGVSR
jgi:hypothetical protein